MPIQSFNPPPRTLMGPGPSDMHPRVLAALSRPVIGHLDPQFVAMMDELKSLLQYAFQTKNQLTLPISAPGSAGMEATLVNLIEPGDTAVVCQNGVFGGRMAQIIKRCGGVVIPQIDPWGEPVDLAKLQSTLKDHPAAKIVAFVHAETSTGALSDAQGIAQIAKQHGCLTVVDTVTSLGGSPLYVDDWGLDAVYSGTQKCLSSTPGISPITLSAAAIDRIQSRKTPVQSWFLDFNLLLGYWGAGAKRKYHHTAPVHALYALHEALVLLHDEGLENAWQRHRKNHEMLAKGLEAMGFRYVVDSAHRLPQLNAVYLPEGVDDGAARRHLLENFNLEVGGGLGDLSGKIWRIGQMGYGSSAKNIALCLSAIKSTLEAQACL